MKLKLKSFPKLQIFLIFLISFSYSCQKEKSLIINKEQFIEIYARLLIINELIVKKEFRDRLLLDLYSENNITPANIDSTISYYNSNPSEWVDIYGLVREKIQKIKNDNKMESSKQIDSLLSKPRDTRPKKSLRKNFISVDEEKELLNQRKKSRNKKNIKPDENSKKSD